MDVDLLASLGLYFGFTEFRPGQREAVQSLLEGKHVLAVMPTGAGKSLIYQLAAMHRQGVTLVISPLIALMKDQVDSLARQHIPAVFINSTLSSGEQSRRLEALAQGRYRIVYIAPERLRSAPFLAVLRSQEIGLLAVDEAHCISEWGHDFRPDYLHIGEMRQQLNHPLTVALTATATPQVQDDIIHLLALPQSSKIVTGFNRPNLTLEVRYVGGVPAKLRALQELVAGSSSFSGEGASIIYTGTRRDAEEVTDFLREVCCKETCYYHAGLEADERTRIQDAFLCGDLPVVVATNAFGMGIDRRDVRQVLHYSLPGSLEAYYQEAGRAGRDGLPARAVLLYDAKDRALQEWFIDSSILTYEDLRVLYQTLAAQSRSKQISITVDKISLLTSFQEVKVRLSLAQLEQCGAIERLGDEGSHMLLQAGGWNEKALRASAARGKEFQDYRKKQLDKIIVYAETNACRREILLAHFGDRGSVEALDCCDNCRQQNAVAQSVSLPARDVSALGQSQRTALIILDAVQRLKTKVGREKLAQILHGSRAADIRKFHYDKCTYYGRLAVFRQGEIEDFIEQLIQRGYLKVIGGLYPVLALTPVGEAAVRGKSAITLSLPRQVSRQEIERKQAERSAGGTVEYTAQLLSSGLDPEQIAQQRGSTLHTIYGHFARLIVEGKISADQVVSTDTLQQIYAAIQQVECVDYLQPIKSLLPDEIDYSVIRCVVEQWKRDHQSISTGFVGSATSDKEIDKIDQFLSGVHPRQLKGSWSSGWALGFHSRFAGSDWNRSAVGELAYRLKYQSDLSVLPNLLQYVDDLTGKYPELLQVEAVVPVPSSTSRTVEPVQAFARALAEKYGLAVLPVLAKSRQTLPQKEMHTFAQKRANVAGAFKLTALVAGKRLLVVDDLFDSGATLEEITRLLLNEKAGKVCVLTLTRTIHSDS